MKILCWVILLYCYPLACLADLAYINQIPDFTQTDVAFSGSGNGQQFCAPVAVSNSIVLLSGNTQAQIDLIALLASSEYMNTSLKNGTGTTGVLRGVNRIAEELFGGYSKLEYQGWRKHPAKYSTGIVRPEITKLKNAISSRSAAWLNVGWYRYEKARDQYRRIGGHWVTLVGADNEHLVIHDPSPRAGRVFSNEFVEYRTIDSGMLVGDKKGLPVEAKGYLMLGKGFHLKRGTDFAIVDGAVFFRL
ncbi:MAG: peptidase C39 family protein [Candidatus Thiodiazotropha lotti]|nr:peptidase C39 family protein [Candidatus Thiodiazotropha lotti]MCG7998253.1 peptidase C39 family protein [Candidatus Thiodiazotropha lotti]MCW4182882.1 peptidase C39 family protein [Candidatus Thiodiazotropha weberae]MCW4190019.1 peptidase C39 family protein [Candidatus Thiodiazotropha weberae]